MSKASEQDEYFEYPPSWEREYLATRTVEEWRSFPDQLPKTGLRRPGTLQYFAQYALMYLLRRHYGIRSLTWMHLASVDQPTLIRLASGEPWIPASPKPCRNNQARTQERREKWKTMRERMGSTLDTLQCAIVGAGFTDYTGEPDLFCYADDGTWLFAEANTDGERLRPLQEKYFAIAENLPGVAIYLCRVVPEGYRRPASQPQHTQRWTSMITHIGQFLWCPRRPL